MSWGAALPEAIRSSFRGALSRYGCAAFCALRCALGSALTLHQGARCILGGMSKSTPHRIIWASAAYDFIVTFAFSTPWTGLWAVDLLRSIHNRWGLPGATPDLSAPMSLLFANLLGTLVCTWSVQRMRHPSIDNGFADTITRLMFAGWMVYALIHGASGVVALFLFAELVWAVVQGAAVFLIASRSGATRLDPLSHET